MSGVDLRVDWCSYEAAKYAVEHWHYSGRMVAGIQRPVKLGVWENGQFIGAIIFGHGASSNLGSQFGVAQFRVCELVRIALDEHKSYVSKIISLALSKFNVLSPSMRLVISFADPLQGHNGSIYQASNWIYTGESSISMVYFDMRGHEYHARNIGSYTGHDKYGVKKIARSEIIRKEKRPGKHRYLYPLDRAMRRQIASLAQPYPKRAGG